MYEHVCTLAYPGGEAYFLKSFFIFFASLFCFGLLLLCIHGVQRRMISVDNFVRIFEIIMFCFVVAI